MAAIDQQLLHREDTGVGLHGSILPGREEREVSAMVPGGMPYILQHQTSSATKVRPSQITCSQDAALQYTQLVYFFTNIGERGLTNQMWIRQANKTSGSLCELTIANSDKCGADSAAG